MNIKAGLGVVLLLLILLTFPLFANNTALSVSTMTISGTVGPRLIIDVASVIGQGDAPANAISLDSGAILSDAYGFGVKVGEWSVDSNSVAILKLKVHYDDFVFDNNSIPYDVYNFDGTQSEPDPIPPDGIFAELKRIGGIYSPEDNSGDIYIKRTDNESYFPSNEYKTTITFTINTE